VLTRQDSVIIGATVAAVIVAAVLRVAGANDVLRFIAAAAALSLLAVNVSRGTGQLGAHLGPAATGILQAALGNLPELLLCTFALRAGLCPSSGRVDRIDPRKLALVLGTGVLVGGLKHGRMHYDASRRD
jgi:Ca2+:H+ antiporter